MLTWIALIFVSIIVVAITRFVFIARAARKAAAKVMELRLDGLKFAIQEWKRCAHDLVPYDTDQYPEREHFWRTVKVQPSGDVTWHFNIDMQKRYRVEVVQLGQPQSWYPTRFGWSTEKWLKQRIDEMLFMIAQLPPPRTHKEWLKKMDDDHRAKMDEYDREHKAWLAEQQTIGGAGLPSLEDPLDDID